MPGLTNHPPRGRGPGRITSIGGHRTRWEVEILNFLVRIHRSGESGATQEFLFVLSYEPTIHGTISRFHNSLANFWLSLTYAILSGRDNRCVPLRQVQTSKQDNHVVQRKSPSTVNLFGGQSGRLKAFQAFQATIGFSVGRLYFGSWILKAPQAFQETIGFIV